MNNLLIYLFKVNLLAVILYGFYRLFLHRQKLSQLNRFILLLLPLIVLGVPLLKLQNLHQDLFHGLALSPDTAYTGHAEAPFLSGSAAEEKNFMIILIWCYFFGVFFFFSRTLIQLIRIVRLMKCSCSRKEGRIRYIITKHSRAFSFFNWIFIPATIGEESRIIMKHEEIHARQGHSLDLLWAELWILLFWYNPAFHLISSDLKTTHEFIADRLMLRGERSTLSYVRALLADAEARLFTGIVSPFSYKSLKQRITMMNRQKSIVPDWVKYVFLLPFMAALILAFSSGPGNPGSLPSIRPVSGAEISFGYGLKAIHPVLRKEFVHKGIDFKADAGTDVMATGDGRVLTATEKEGWGNLIVLDHGGNILTYYAHLKDILVKEGEYVSKGRVIGHVGNTGYSTGPHLHYEVRVEGEPVDPSEYFD